MISFFITPMGVPLTTRCQMVPAGVEGIQFHAFVKEGEAALPLTVEGHQPPQNSDRCRCVGVEGKGLLGFLKEMGS